MGEQADLREQAKRRTGRQGDKPAVLPQAHAGKRSRRRGRAENCRVCGLVAIGRQSHLLWRPGEIDIREIQTQIVTITPTTAVAAGKPHIPMAATQSGENTTPPMLAPL